MTSKELLKASSRKDISIAKGLLVRELEEEKKGFFVAYVDVGEHSFDVAIHRRAKKVTQMTCDCEEGATLCVHKIAVLLTIEGEKSTAHVALKKSKKVSEAETLLNHLEKEEITQWLVEVFKKDKAFEQQFVLKFEAPETTFTKERVQEILQAIVTSVAGKRKTLEGIKIKKMLDLITVASKAINHYLLIKIDEQEAMAIFDAYLGEIRDFDKRVKHYSKRTSTFVYDYSAWFALAILNIQLPEKRQQVITMYLEYMTTKKLVKHYDFRYYVILNIYQLGNLQEREWVLRWIKSEKKKLRDATPYRHNFFLDRFSDYSPTYYLDTPVDQFFK